jgi:ferritin
MIKELELYNSYYYDDLSHWFDNRSQIDLK